DQRLPEPKPQDSIGPSGPPTQNPWRLLDHLEMRRTALAALVGFGLVAFARTIVRRRGRRRCRTVVLVGKHHALTVFLRVNGQYGRYWKTHRVAGPGKTRLAADPVVAEIQVGHGLHGQVQHHLAVAHGLRRNVYTFG